MGEKLVPLPETSFNEAITPAAVAEKGNFYILDADVVTTRFGDRLRFTIQFEGEDKYYALFLSVTDARKTLLDYVKNALAGTTDVVKIGPCRLVKRQNFWVFVAG